VAEVAGTETRHQIAQLAHSHRRQYVGWILQAKRDETRRRRIRETVSRVAQGKRPGID
jgi:uncharacterized protein YdeI (YjbR/CyaY-like superfamily)